MFESKNERSDNRSHASLALIRGDRDDLTNQWLNSMKGIVDPDGKFGKIVQEMYKQEYKTTFEKLETWYENEAIDEIRALAMQAAGASWRDHRLHHEGVSHLVSRSQHARSSDISLSALHAADSALRLV